MKKLLLVVLLLVSASAYAGTWMLVHSEVVFGTGWLCTYQLQGSSYQATIIEKNFCQMVIWQ